MQRAALLLLLATLEVVDTAEDEATDEIRCAEIVSDLSNVYPQATGDWHFKYTLKVHRWVPKMHILIDFGEAGLIDQVFGGASEVDQSYAGQGAPAPRLELPVPSSTHCIETALTLCVPIAQWTRTPLWSS